MNDRSRFQGGRSPLLLVVLALLAAPAARAAEPAATPPPAPACVAPVAAPAPAAPTVDAAAGAGMLAFIDPQTGRLTSAPTDEQREAMRIALSSLIDQSTEGLEAVRHPDGRLSMNVKGRMMDFAVIRLEPNGKHAVRCAATVDQAADLLVTPAIPTVDGLEVQ